MTLRAVGTKSFRSRKSNSKVLEECALWFTYKVDQVGKKPKSQSGLKDDYAYTQFNRSKLSFDWSKVLNFE